MEMTRIDTFFGVTKKPKKLQKKTPFNHLPAYTFTFANVSTVVQVTKRTHDGLLFFHRHFRLFKFCPVLCKHRKTRFQSCVRYNQSSTPSPKKYQFRPFKFTHDSPVFGPLLLLHWTLFLSYFYKKIQKLRLRNNQSQSLYFYVLCCPVRSNPKTMDQNKNLWISCVSFLPWLQLIFFVENRWEYISWKKWQKYANNNTDCG